MAGTWRGAMAFFRSLPFASKLLSVLLVFLSSSWYQSQQVSGCNPFSPLKLNRCWKLDNGEYLASDRWVVPQNSLFSSEGEPHLRSLLQTLFISSSISASQDPKLIYWKSSPFAISLYVSASNFKWLEQFWLLVMEFLLLHLPPQAPHPWLDWALCYD